MNKIRLTKLVKEKNIDPRTLKKLLPKEAIGKLCPDKVKSPYLVDLDLISPEKVSIEERLTIVEEKVSQLEKERDGELESYMS